MKHLYYEHHCKKYDWTLFVKVGFVHFSYLGRGGSWVVNRDLSSSMHQIRYMDWIVRRGQLMGNRAFDRVAVHAGPYYLVHSLVARQCHGLCYQLCLLCSGSQSSLTICILHMWPQMGRKRSQCRPACGFDRSLTVGSVQQGRTTLVSALWIRCTRPLVAFLGAVQPFLIFLPSLKWVLHKFSWPGKFLRGQ